MTENNLPTSKKYAVNLVGGAEEIFDLYTGDSVTKITDTKDENLGIEISHILKTSEENFCCGENARLNIHEKLIQKEDSSCYTYIDSLGDAHPIEESFYYIDSEGYKWDISNKESITVLANGRLEYEDSNSNGKIFEVTRKEKTKSGIEVVTKLEDVKSVEYFEQRQEKIKEIEDKKTAYEKALLDYVLVSGETTVSDNIDSIISNINSENNYKCYTKSEKLNLESLGNSIIDASIKLEKAASEEERQNLNNQIFNFDEQKDYIESQNNKNKETVIAMYKEYLILAENLSVARNQIPKNYVVYDKLIKGFNENGDLVVIYDNHGKYVAFEYEVYYQGESKKYRVCRAVNEKEQQMQFIYDHNNLLVEIINSNGEATKFEYGESDNSQKVVYSNGEYVQVIQNSGEKQICTMYKTATVSDVTEQKEDIKSLISKAVQVRVSKNNESSLINEIILYKNSTAVKVIDDMQSGFKLRFDGNGNITEYQKIQRLFVVSANKYEYDEENKCVKVIYPTLTCLKNAQIERFDFECEYSIRIIYDEFDRVKKEEMLGSQSITDTSSQQTVKDYFYNKLGQLCKTQTKIDLLNTDENVETSKTLINKLEYNSNNLVVREEAYEEEKLAACGANITEYKYDKNNYLVKTIKYNSLDPSSKYYSEQEYDENGKLIFELDSTGEHKILHFENGIVQPNGTKYSEGYDRNGRNISITQSTKDGEESSIQRQYTNGLLTRVMCADDVYEYKYNSNGKADKVLINEEEYVRYTYNDESPVSRTEKLYQSGLKETYTQGPTAKTYTATYENSSISIEELGRRTKETVYMAKNGIRNAEYSYEYDSVENIKSIIRYSIVNDQLVETYREDYTYYDDGKISNKSIVSRMPRSNDMQYEYDEETERLKKYSCAGPLEIYPSFDCLGRNIGRKFAFNGNELFTESISYLKQGDHATNLPLGISFSRYSINGVNIKENIKYKYDKMGNICEIRENGVLKTRYAYDSLNRLVREDNRVLDKTVIFEYDRKGNIVSQRKYSFTLKSNDYLDEQQPTKTTDYEYRNGKLVVFDGQRLEYDCLGNPTEYKGDHLEWCPLTKKLLIYNGNNYEYDVSGNRVKKNDLIQYDYDCSGNLMSEVGNDREIVYYYDYNNSVIAFSLYSQLYFYKKDVFGNVVEILDSYGNTMVKYVYDAWGNHEIIDYTSYNLGQINPIRYRSYYYDTETGLYYLQSRYYDPEVGRFISMDDISYLDPETIGGTNLYAYCLNNPIMYVDPSGHEWYNPFTWDWGEIAKGVGLIITGIGAIAVGIITLPYGGWISAVAGVTILAGGGTALFGLSDVGEGITDYNVIQKAVFMGNENAYNITESIFATTATIGSIVCGVYIKYNTTTTPRSLPGKGQKPHSGVWNVNDKTLGYYGADGKLRYSIAFNNHKTPSVHRIPHWHTEMPHSEPINSLWRFVIELIKRGF